MSTTAQRLVPLLVAPLFLFVPLASAQDAHQDLAKASQNPVANLISVPIQANANFGVLDDKTSFLNLVQPVIPQNINEDWNWIHRGIIPLPVYQPGLDDSWGLGDIQYEGFLSPAKPGKFIWGVGPYLSFPTASDDVLGTEKWSAGPAMVGLTMPGNWVVGGLFTHLWSYAGDDDREDVSLSAIQYFLNYNIPNSGGWYLSSSPTMTYDWYAESGQRWTVPVGGGVGKVFQIGSQHVNAKLQAFAYPVKPDNGPEWSVQLQFTFLFPQ